MLGGAVGGVHTQQTVITYVRLQQDRRAGKAMGVQEGKGAPYSRIWLMPVVV